MSDQRIDALPDGQPFQNIGEMAMGLVGLIDELGEIKNRLSLLEDVMLEINAKIKTNSDNRFNELLEQLKSPTPGIRESSELPRNYGRKRL